MKNKVFLIILTSVHLISFSQTDSLYLGLTPPGKTPIVFNVKTESGYKPSDRIAITNNGKEIYYSIVNINNDYDKKLLKYTYKNNTWEGPEVVFTGEYHAPSLSPDGQTMFMDGFMKSYSSTKTSDGWGIPVKDSQFFHYTQETNSGNIYAAYNGYISIRSINGTDTTFIGLGANMRGGGHYIAKDESYMIFTNNKLGDSNLYISYKNGDRWTYPKFLGSDVNNSGDEDFGAYVNEDMYLFFSRFSYSTYELKMYWVKVDELIDSLKNTNYEPYLISNIPDFTDTVGNYFSYTLPDTVFFDDDGNETLEITAKKQNGDDLPSWLHFDGNTFTANLVEAGRFSIKITATDNTGASVSDMFRLVVSDVGNAVTNYKSDHKLRVYPNPLNNYLVVNSDNYCSFNYKILSADAKQILSGMAFTGERISTSGLKEGIYLINIEVDGNKIIQRFIVH